MRRLHPGRGCGGRQHRAVLDRLGAQAGIDGSRAVVEAARGRATKGGSLTGAHPVECGHARRPAARPHRHRGPAAGGGGQCGPPPGRLAFTPLVPAIPAICSRCGPRRHRPATRHADPGDDDHRRTWRRARRLPPRIIRHGVQTSERLGRHRWQVEPTIAWLFGYRRLTLRDERSARLCTAFLTLAATLTCDKRLPR